MDRTPRACRSARETLSARLDGVADVDERDVDAHLAECAGCREWERAATGLTRRLRLHAVPDVPDLAGPVVAAVQQSTRASWTPARGGLVVLGLVQLLLSLPPLLGAGYGLLAGASVHVSREVGVTQVALAVGVLAAAARPWRAAGMLPVVLALALGLTVVAAADVLSGRVGWAAESVHLLALADALLLWLVRHRDPLAAVPGPLSRPQDPGEGPRLASSA